MSLYEDIDSHIQKVIDRNIRRGIFHNIPMDDGSNFDILKEIRLSQKMIEAKDDSDIEIIEQLLQRIRTLEDRKDFVDSLARQRAFQALSAISRQLFQKYMKENIAQIKHVDGVIELFTDDSMIDATKSTAYHTVENGMLYFDEAKSLKPISKTVSTTISNPTVTVRRDSPEKTPCLYVPELGGTMYLDVTGSIKAAALWTRTGTYTYRFNASKESPETGYLIKGRDGRIYCVVTAYKNYDTQSPTYSLLAPCFMLYDVTDIKASAGTLATPVPKIAWETSIFAKTYEAYMRTIARTDGVYQSFAAIDYSPATDTFYGIGLLSKTKAELSTNASAGISATGKVVWIVDNKTGVETMPSDLDNKYIPSRTNSVRTWLLTPKGTFLLNNSDTSRMNYFDSKTGVWVGTTVPRIDSLPSRYFNVGEESWVLIPSSRFLQIVTESFRLGYRGLTITAGGTDLGLLFPTPEGTVIANASVMTLIDHDTSTVQLKPFTTTESATGVLLSLSGEFDDVVKNDTIQVSTDNGTTWVTPEFEFYDGMYEAYLDGSKHKTILIRCTFKYAQKKRIWNALGVMWI